MVTAFVLISAKRDLIPETAQALSALEGVAEVYSVAGPFDIVAVIRVRTNEELADLVTGHLLKLKGIERSETLIAFRAFSKFDLERMFSHRHWSRVSQAPVAGLGPVRRTMSRLQTRHSRRAKPPEASRKVFTIREKQQLAPNIYRMKVLAPKIAQKRKAGQFVILRVSETGERFPLTIADSDPAAGTITIIFQVAGRSTTILGALNVGRGDPRRGRAARPADAR